MKIRLINSPITKEELKKIAKEGFGDLVKAVVDIRKELIVLGGELHTDEEVLLLESGSNQEDLWGINLYPFKEKEDFIEFDSVINLRPKQKNFSRGIDDPKIKEAIKEIVKKLIV
ncbi:MAG: DUF5674 family protein [Candidatus Omnitrophica bacterium]|nr:DUF5674 family protein [Candidatus Omnitrophota bacterium]